MQLGAVAVVLLVDAAVVPWALSDCPRSQSAQTSLGLHISGFSIVEAQYYLVVWGFIRKHSLSLLIFTFSSFWIIVPENFSYYIAKEPFWSKKKIRADLFFGQLWK